LLAQGPVPDNPYLHGEAKPSRSAPVAQPVKLFATTITHPDAYLKLAIAHLEKLPEQDRLFTRFVAAHATPDPLLTERTTLSETYYNTANTANTLARFLPNVGGDKRLLAIDLRKTRWTVEAWTASVREDQKFREPHCDPILAERARQLIGVQQDPVTFHVDVMVPLEWFMRELMEPGGRTALLYNLTYPEERFGKTQFSYLKQSFTEAIQTTKKVQKIREVPWKGGIWPEDGKFYAAGSFNHKEEYEVDEPVGIASVPSFTIVGQQKVSTKVIKDFPEDLTQFQDRWGITDAQKTLDRERIFAKRGEVVGGSRNVKNGSFVAYNDRVIEILVLAGGFPSMRTRDFRKTSGKSNPANDPRGVAIGDLQEDAGEHLVTLPSGLQTAFLTGGAKDGRKRVEFGDAEVVHSSKDPSFGVVKTQFSCAICHAPSFGVLDPSNTKVKDGIRRLRSPKTNQGGLLDADPHVADALAAFFVGWEEDTEYWRLPYKKALRTLTTRPDNLGWTGQKFADETIRFRDWYDAPVSLEQAAVELGVPRLAMMLVCMQDGGLDTQNLFMGESIPRAEWDDVLYRKLALTLSVMRNAESPSPLFAWLLPELLRKGKVQK
jgi:hypothetical protein